MLQEIIAFQADKSIEVRKFVIGFIEEAWYGAPWECCVARVPQHTPNGIAVLDAAVTALQPTLHGLLFLEGAVLLSEYRQQLTVSKPPSPPWLLSTRLT